MTDRATMLELDRQVVLLSRLGFARTAHYFHCRANRLWRELRQSSEAPAQEDATVERRPGNGLFKGEPA